MTEVTGSQGTKLHVSFTVDKFILFIVMCETEDDLIKMLIEWKDNMENRGMRININKTKVMISRERQKLM